MSKTIDEKVVSFKFENSKFQQKAKETLTLLDKLKDKLNFKDSAKNVREFQRSIDDVDFSEMNNGLTTVSKKFNALQTMAEAALTRIATKAVDAGTTLVKSLTIDQVTAGYSKLESKTASVQTIMNSTGASIEEVNGWLDQLMWFADETSYSFTDMTASLGQLTASGGDVEKLMPMIMGVANATAYAGKTTAEFSRAIYNLNQSYSAGNLQLMDWKSLELAGVASKALKETIIQAGIDNGTLVKKWGSVYTKDLSTEVTVGTFNSTLAKKWANKEVMEQAFGEFYEYTRQARELIDEDLAETATEAYDMLEKWDESLKENLYFKAARAAQAAKTFGEVVDATKDAVSSKWMTSFELILGNYEEAKELWSNVAEDFYDIFASSGDRRNEVLSAAMDSIDGIGEDIIDGWIDEMQRLTKKLEDPKNELKDSLWGGWASVFDDNTMYFANAEKFKDVRITENNLRDYLKSGLVTAEDIKELYVTEDLDKMTEYGVTLSELIDMIIYGPQEGRRGGREMLHESIHSFLQAIINIKSVMDDVKESVFGTFVSDTIYNAIKGLNKFTTSFESLTALTKRFNAEGEDAFTSGEFSDAQINNFKMLQRLFSSIFGILKVGASILRLVVTFFTKLIASIGKLVTRSLPLFTVNLEKITKFLSNMIEAIEKWLDENDIIEASVTAVSDAISTLYGYLSDLIQKIWELPAVQAAIEVVKTKFEEFKQTVKDLFEDLKNTDWEAVFTTIVGSIVLGVTTAIETLVNTDWAGLFTKAMSTAKTAVGNFLTETKEKATLSTEQVEKLKESLSWIADYGYAILTGFLAFAGIKKLLDIASAIASLPEALADIITGITKIFTNLGKLVKAKVFETQMKALLNVALGITLIVAALFILTKIDPKAMKTALIELTIVFTLLGAFVLIMSAVAESFTKNPNIIPAMAAMSALFISIAAASLIIAGALALMGHLKDPKKSLAIFGAAFGSIAIALALISGLGLDKSTKGVVLTMIGIIIALRMVIGLLRSLSTLTFSAEQIDQIIDNLILVAKTIMGMFGVLWAIEPVAAKASVSLMALLSIVVAIRIVLSLLKKISRTEPEEIAKGILGLIPIFTALTMLLYGFNDTGEGAKNAGIFIVGLAASLFLMAFAIAKLGKIPNDELKKGGKAAALLAAALGGIAALVVKLTEGFKNMNFKSTLSAILFLVALSGSLFILVGVMKLLAKMEWDEIRKGLVGILGMLAGLTAPLWAASKISAESFKALIPVAVMIGLVLGAFLLLAFKADPVRVAAVADGLLKAFGGLSAAFGGLAALVFASRGITVSTLVTIGGLIIEVTAILAAIVGLAGYLATIEGMDSFLDGAENVLTKFGSAIGGFFGGIVGGFANSALMTATRNINVVGERLTRFGKELKPFMDLMKDESMATGIQNAKSLFELMVYLASENIVNAFQSASVMTANGTMTGIKNFFSQYADAVVELSSKFKGVNIATDQMRSATEIGKGIADMVNAIPKGKKTFGQFTTDVVAYVNTVIDISKQLTDKKNQIDLAVLDHVLNAGDAVSKFVNGLGESIENYDTKSGKEVIKQLKDILQLCTSFAGLDSDSLHPVITPVIDMSQFDEQMKNLQGKYSMTVGLDTSGSTKKAATAANATTNNTTNTTNNKTNNIVNHINMVVNGAAGQNINQLADAVINKIGKNTLKESTIWG